MKLSILLFLLLINSLVATGQTTVSKTCGKCHKQVSAYAQIGQKCPHCGVRWGYENTSTSTYSEYGRSSEDKPLLNNERNNNSTVQPIKSSKSNNISKASSQTKTKIKVSKSETEAWILQKLTKYAKERVWCSEVPCYMQIGKQCCYHEYYQSFSFSGSQLRIAYKDDNGVSHSILVPMEDLDYIYGYADLMFMSKRESVIVTNLNDGKVYRTSSAQLAIEYKMEQDLVERLKKAFTHLQSFYNKRTDDEPF